MVETSVGTVFELSLRVLLMLNEAFPLQLDARQIAAVDFISVYAADFGLMDENLHGNNNYRYSEYLARKPLVDEALRNLVLDGCVQMLPTSAGYCYSILEAGKEKCEKMTSSYAGEYALAVGAVISRYKYANMDAMIKAINNATIQSMQEIRYE